MKPSIFHSLFYSKHHAGQKSAALHETEHENKEHDMQFDMESLVGAILLVGVLLSISLLIIGIAWYYALTGHLGVHYQISGMNLFSFFIQDLHQVFHGLLQPHILISLGINVLMLTPYTRVLISMLYFAFVEHNFKYTMFTGFVLVVLTYSLFLR